MPENAVNRSNPETLSVNATSVFLKKDLAAAVGGMSSSGAPSISCNILSAGKWAPKNFSPGKSFLKIGSSQTETDLCLQSPSVAKLHCSLRLVFTTWFILESAPERGMLINGAQRPQMILKPGDACSININGDEILLQSVASKEATAAGNPLNPDKTVSFKSQAAELKYRMDASSLIGSDKTAAIHFQELPPFAGIVFSFANRPYLHAFDLNGSSLQVDGQSAAEAPRELREGAAISFAGKKVCHIALPEALHTQQPYSGTLKFNGNLALQEVSSTRFGSKLILPGSGRSITIGREADNHFIMESGSISKKHAQLLIYDNSIMVLDCRSTNGTFIEEEQISKKLLHPGEIVRFADKRFLLCHAE